MKKPQLTNLRKRKRADDNNSNDDQNIEGIPLTIHDITWFHKQFWTFNTDDYYENVVTKTRALSFFRLDEKTLSTIRHDRKRPRKYCFIDIIVAVFEKFGSAENFIADQKIRTEKKIAA